MVTGVDCAGQPDYPHPLAHGDTWAVGIGGHPCLPPHQSHQTRPFRQSLTLVDRVATWKRSLPGAAARGADLGGSERVVLAVAAQIFAEGHLAEGWLDCSAEELPGREDVEKCPGCVRARAVVLPGKPAVEQRPGYCGAVALPGTTSAEQRPGYYGAVVLPGKTAAAEQHSVAVLLVEMMLTMLRLRGCLDSGKYGRRGSCKICLR